MLPVIMPDSEEQINANPLATSIGLVSFLKGRFFSVSPTQLVDTL